MRKNFSRIIAVLLAVIMMITAAPVAYAGDEIASGTVGEGINWVISADGTLTISGEGEPVVEWYSPPWKDYNDSIKAIVVKEGITALPSSIFCYAENCTTLSIPKSVELIGDYVLWASYSLEEIKVDPDNQYYCSVDGILYTKDKSALVVYPAKKACTEFTIPATVTKLKEYSFAYNKNIDLLNIPDTVETIEENAFASSYFKAVNLSNSITKIATSLFSNSKIENIIIPDSVEIIEDSAFRDSKIRSVTIGTGVTTIGDSVFEYCDQFTTVHYTGTPEMFEAIQVDEEDNDIFFSADVHYMDADDVKEASSVPTCTEDAHTSGYYCDQCDVLVTGKILDFALGHDWSSTTGVCDVCGEDCDHIHYDLDGLCDVCGKETPFPQAQLDQAADVFVPDDVDGVVYQFTAPEDGTYEVYSFDSNSADPTVEIFNSDDKNIADDDDDGGGRDFFCKLELAKGETVKISLGSYHEIPYSFMVCKHVEVSHQPTQAEPYVELSWDVDAIYLWFEAELDITPVTDENAQPYFSDENGESVYDENSGWLGVYEDYENRLFSIELEQGDMIKLVPSEPVDELIVTDTENDQYCYYVDGEDKEELYFEAPETSTYSFDVYSGIDNVYYKADLIKPDYTLLEGETLPAIQNIEFGKYYRCVVIVGDKIFETDIFKNSYAITSQPTSNNVTVGLNYGDGATYQWYIVDEQYEEITDQNAQIVEYYWGVTSYDSEKGWVGVDDYYEEYLDFFTIELQKGDVLYLETDYDYTEGIGLYDYGEGTNLWGECDDSNGIYFKVMQDGTYTSYSHGISGETCIKGYFYNRNLIKLDGETSATLSTTDSNTYVCLVTFADGTKEYSKDVTVIPSGWNQDSNGWYYIDSNGNRITSSWMQDSIGWCYLGADGYMETNQWIQDSQGWCYVGDDGYCVTNSWMADSIGWCYLDGEGRMATNQWIQDSQGWCYVGADGYCVTNSWMADSIGWCYLDGEGRMATNQWIQDSQGWCYVGGDGYCVTNSWMKDSIGWCYLDENGRMVYNKWIEDSNGWCYIGSDGYYHG